MKGKAHTYELNNLKQLQWSHKQLLLPIIAGGFISSISVVAYMSNLLHPWMLVLLFMGGVLAMYYGFIGSPALVISLKSYNEYYLIREKSIFLQEFTDFVNLYLTRKEPPCYLIAVTKEKWGKAKEVGHIQIDEPQELLNKYNFEKNEILLKIDFQQLYSAITYLQSDESNSLKPYITENIPLSAVSVVG